MTEVATGANAQVLMAKESEYGVTPDSANFKKYVFKSCGLDGSQSLIENDDLGMIGTWLTGLLGSAVTTENAGVYTHVFSSGKENLPSFSIEKSFKEVKDYSLFNGCKFGSMDFDFQSDGNASVAVSIIGKKEANSETSIQATPTQLEYKPFSNAQGFVKVDGIDADIVSGSLSLNNNINAIETIREDNEISGVDVGMFNATGSISIRFKDKALLNKAINGETVALDMGFKFADNEKMAVKILQAHLSKPSKSIDGPGGIELSFDFQGAKNETAGKMVEVELVNGIATY
ncbi:MAG: hypothetical protein GY793_06325 [Proteobacteria bacterium]|nr:hypothetical protein [Pseudomonadota bacterium]